MASKKADWTETERDTWRPLEKLTVSKWADRYRILVPQTSAEPGPWRTVRTPYLKEIMDDFSDPYVEKVVFETGSQLGKTEVLYNCLGYIIHQAPAPALLIMPTLDLARYVSRNRIQPMINASDPICDRKPANDDEFTMLEMTFPGMVLSLAGANSPASLANSSSVHSRSFSLPSSSLTTIRSLAPSRKSVLISSHGRFLAAGPDMRS